MDPPHSQSLRSRCHPHPAPEISLPGPARKRHREYQIVVVSCAPGLVGVGGCRTRGRKPLDGFRNQLRCGLLRLFGGSPFWSSLLGLAGFFQQLDISRGSPRDERAPGTFFGVFFDGFYGDSTGVVADQPSVEAAPSGEPHSYSLSIPLLRQVPGQRASPVRLLSPGILPLPEAFALVRSHPHGCVMRTWALRTK